MAAQSLTHRPIKSQPKIGRISVVFPLPFIMRKYNEIMVRERLTVARPPSHSSFSISVKCKRPLDIFFFLFFFFPLHFKWFNANCTVSTSSTLYLASQLVYTHLRHVWLLPTFIIAICWIAVPVFRSNRKEAWKQNWDIVRLNVLPHRIRHANRVHNIFLFPYFFFSSFASVQCIALNDMVY